MQVRTQRRLTIHWQNGGRRNSFISIKNSSVVQADETQNELINNNLSLIKNSADVSADGTRNIATSPMLQR
jgi:hypothetical protein